MGKRRKQTLLVPWPVYFIMKASQMRMDKIKEASCMRSEAACIWQVLIKIKKEKEPHGKESRVIGAW